METQPLAFTPQPRSKKLDLFDRYKYYTVGALTLITGIGVYVMLTPPANTLASDEAIVLADSDEPETNTTQESQLVIDVAGGIQKPGVYWLNSGAIVEDAIKSAGGFSATADLDAIAKEINRAQKLEPNTKIYLPKKGDSIITATSLRNPGSTNSTAQTSTLININTAQNAELDLLPGVGAVTSQRIIDYRLKNGSFKSLEDLKNVPGISDSKFNQMKGLITI